MILALLPQLTYDELTVLLVGLNRVELDYTEVQKLAQSTEIHSLTGEVLSIARSLTTAVSEARYTADRPTGGVLEALRLAWEDK